MHLNRRFPPPAGSFPLQPALLRRFWPSFDPLPVFCGLSVPFRAFPCLLRAFSVPSPCSFLALSLLPPCSLRASSLPFPCSFLALLPISLTGGEPPLRAFGVMHAPASSIYRQSFVFFRSPVNAVFLGPLFRYRCAAKNRARFFRSGLTFSYRPAASFLSDRACCFIHIYSYFGLKMPK